VYVQRANPVFLRLFKNYYMIISGYYEDQLTRPLHLKRPGTDMRR
jgi:hypothetical protein